MVLVNDNANVLGNWCAIFSVQEEQYTFESYTVLKNSNDVQKLTKEDEMLLINIICHKQLPYYCCVCYILS